MSARLLAVVAALGVLLSACGLPGQLEGSREITATFDDVGDLVSGHSVQVADVRVGSVVGIELTDDFRAEVTMSLQDGLDIPASSTARLRTTSLLGEKFIELRAPAGTDPTAGPFFDDGDVVGEVETAPELEFVAEEAVMLLGSVAASDLQTLVQTGAVGFGGRAEELTGIVENLGTISATLAAQTDDIVTIIDGFDELTRALADGAPTLSELLVNLDDTVALLAENRQQIVDGVEQLTRLAQLQNELVLEPHLADIDRQIKQVDAIVAEVEASRSEVGLLLQWLAEFAERVPVAVPNEFAQVYAFLVVAPTEEPAP